MLTETSFPASDRRAVFVGVDAYEAAGGVVLRDLFQGDDGGWLEDPALLDRLVAEELQAKAEALASEGWKWIEVATDLPYGYSHGLRRLAGDPAPLTDEESAAHVSLLAEYRALEEEYSGQDEYPEEIDARLGQLEMAMEALEQRPLIFDPAEVSRAGVFVTLDRDGSLAVYRGYVRPEDGSREETAVQDGDGAGGACWWFRLASVSVVRGRHCHRLGMSWQPISSSGPVHMSRRAMLFRTPRTWSLSTTVGSCRRTNQRSRQESCARCGKLLDQSRRAVGQKHHGQHSEPGAAQFSGAF
jgi:hypothetical protein